ncbi:glycosyltransferase 87 family protein [Cellulomonas phragmiteti]|uniref:DUF2029 domain-containing protein n=1 Tax=Cellulomonas phragmiteti TaxID=478780 RepID=A0ABQ4DN35_9CELL|nr:glycosyltransferase 87 family protein [Cellulomonas phragmiteti]GIG40754.1 hypothetical protein Cph01nite_25160 [Cellulomonas phragmiteti]
MHGWLAHLGTGPMAGSFADVDLYRRWVEAGLTEGTWPVLDGPWVYPAGALLPILAPAVVGVTDAAPYAEAWCVLVTLLGAAAVALLLRAPRGHLAATWWLAFTALLGPVAMGRLEGVAAPLSIVALLLALRHPRAATALVTVAAWIKVAPGAAALPLLVAARRPWRDVVVPGLVVCAVVVGTVVALGGGAEVASFVRQQETRGLQVEAVAATPWLVAGLWTPTIRRDFDLVLITYEIHGPGTQATADALGALLPLAVLAVTGLLWWRRRQHGPRFWTEELPRLEVVLRGTFVLTLVLVVVNKVGSPQYMAWLAPPVAVALALGAPRWGRSALGLLGAAAATQWVYPWWYSEVIAGLPWTTSVLAARNVALVVLLVVAVRHLVRPWDAGPQDATSAAGGSPAADASGAVRGQPGQEVGLGAAVVDRGVG